MTDKKTIGSGMQAQDPSAVDQDTFQGPRGASRILEATIKRAWKASVRELTSSGVGFRDLLITALPRGASSMEHVLYYWVREGTYKKVLLDESHQKVVRDKLVEPGTIFAIYKRGALWEDSPACCFLNLRLLRDPALSPDAPTPPHAHETR